MGVGLVLVVLLVLLVLYDYVRSYFELRRIGAPYRLGVPLFYRLPWFIYTLRNGNIYDSLVDRMVDADSTVVAQKRSMFGVSYVISADPAVNKYILSNIDKYEKGELFTDALEPFLGSGIFNVNGQKWLDQRKHSAFMFSKREVKNMVNVFLKHFSMVERYVEVGKKIEFQEFMSAYTLDSFCELSFGIEMDSYRGNKDFADAFNTALNASFQRFVMTPYYKWTVISKYFQFEKDLKSACGYLDNMLYGLIDERRNDCESRGDLLSKYLVLQKEQRSKGKLDAGELEITDKYVRDILLNFIIAGRDTTAQTLLWGTYLLSLPENADVRRKLTEEIEGLETLDYDSLSSLDYTERFIYETLRLYPPVPGDPKTATQDDVLPGGYRVKKGDSVIWSANALGRLPKFWHQPEKVNPDRWLGKEYNGGIEPHIWSGAFIPFQNQGRRVCMGQQMALLEAKAVLASFVKAKIEFSVAPDQKIVRFPNVTICAKNGIHLIPQERK